MAAPAEGIFAVDGEKVQQPAEIAEELAATEPSELPQAIREDQIQNAVAFLTHPKVQSSSAESKRSFLVRKGLTGPEIDEAFSRVPETSNAGGSGDVTATTQLPITNPRKPFPTSQAMQPVPYIAQQQQQQPPQSYRWGQALIGASVLVAGAYALKQLVGPYAVSLYHRLYSIEPDLAPASLQEREDGKTAELLASAISSQNSELREAVDSLKQAVLRLEKGKEVAGAPQEPALSVSDLREELHALALTLSSGGAKSSDDSSVTEQLRELKALLADRLPENGTQAPKPAAVRSNTPAAALTNGGHAVGPPAARFAQSRPSEPSVSASSEKDQSIPYHEVLEMLERGETPPNVRTDINDKPPNPSIPPPTAKMQPRTKPWERSKSRSPAPNDTAVFSANAGEEPSSAGVTITELDDSPSSSRPSSGAWKPPPVPSASLKLSASGDAAEGSASDDD